MRRQFLLILFVVLLIGGSFAIPMQLPVQGKLKGQTAGDVNKVLPFTFSIYSVASGGAAIWSQTKNVDVNIIDTDNNIGVFSTLIGDVDLLDFNSHSDMNFLGIKIQSNAELSPRIRIGATAYAYVAKRLAAVEDLNIESFGVKAFGDSNFNRVYANFLFGNGSGLTGVLATTNWTDINAHVYGKLDVNAGFVPYIAATKDVNLGVYGLKAFGDSNFHSTGISGTLFGSNTSFLGIDRLQCDGCAADGTRSVALGYVSTAGGDYSFAMGYVNTANGIGSVALGDTTGAYGDYSFAVGKDTRAYGSASAVIGNSLTVYDDNTLLVQDLNVLRDSNLNSVTATAFFGSGAALTDITAGSNLPDTTCDNNTACQTWLFGLDWNSTLERTADINTFFWRKTDVNAHFYGKVDANAHLVGFVRAGNTVDLNLAAGGLTAWDGNFYTLEADKLFGDASGVTGVLTLNDGNAHYVPYIGADYDVNLGIYGIKASNSVFTRVDSDWFLGKKITVTTFSTIGNGEDMENGLGVGDLNVQDDVYTTHLHSSNIYATSDSNTATLGTGNLFVNATSKPYAVITKSGENKFFFSSDAMGVPQFYTDYTGIDFVSQNIITTGAGRFGDLNSPGSDNNIFVLGVYKIFGDGSGLTGIESSGGTATIDANVNEYNWLMTDLNKNYYGKLDVNRIFESKFDLNNFYYQKTDINANFQGKVDLNANFPGFIRLGNTTDMNLAQGGLTAWDGNYYTLEADYLFGNGSGLTNLPAGNNLPDSTLDNNALAQAWYWAKLNALIPWADVNVANDITLMNLTQITTRSYSDLQNQPYIPTELDIDRNAMAWDTNTNTLCDGNTVLTGTGVCQSITGFYLSGSSISDTNFQTFADFNNWYYSKFISLQRTADLNNFFVQLQNAYLYDSNTNTVCDGNTVLTGTGLCQSITDFYLSGGADGFTATLDVNAAERQYLFGLDWNSMLERIADINAFFYRKTDVNAGWYGKLDVNNQFVPYIGAARDVNLNFRDLNAKSISAVHFFGSGAALTGIPTQTDVNANFYGKIDINAQFVPYIGATKNINIGNYGLTAKDLNATSGVKALGLFSTTAQIGNMRIGSGSITDSSDAIDFGNAVLTTGGDILVTVGIVSTAALSASSDSNLTNVEADYFFGNGSGLTNVSASTNWADINAHVYGKLDVNTHFVPYIGATRDVNLNSHDLNAFTVLGNKFRMPTTSASGSGAVAFGSATGNIIASGIGSLAAGRAFGANVPIWATDEGSIAMGYAVGAEGIKSTAFGSIAMGYGGTSGVKSGGLGSISLGFDTKAFGIGAISIGSDTNANCTTGCVAIGYQTINTTDNSVALGLDVNVARTLKVMQDVNISKGVNKGVSISGDVNRICFPSNSCEMYIDYNSTAMVFGSG
jgi:hypothetical protein